MSIDTTNGHGALWRSAGRSAAPMPAGFAAGAAFAGGIVATILAVAFGSTHDPLWALLPLGLVTAAVSAGTSWVGAVATAWICWSLDSGFVIGREAQLTFSRPAQLAALLLLAIALLAGGIGRAIRRARSSQPIQASNDRPESFS